MLKNRSVVKQERLAAKIELDLRGVAYANEQLILSQSKKDEMLALLIEENRKLKQKLARSEAECDRLRKVV